MTRALLTAVTSFAIAAALAPFTIPWLRKMKFGQTIYDLGPDSHKAKQGTPTMGGILFAIPMLIVPLVAAYGEARWGKVLVVTLSTLLFGAVGFADDFIKVHKKRSLGLTPMQKILPQVAIALGFAIWAYFSGIGSAWKVPFTDISWDLGWFFIPATVFVMVGIVNSANLLDGLDGLLGSCSAVNFATFSVISMLAAAKLEGVSVADEMNLAVFSASAFGAMLGFLLYNSHPAKVFMGDIGAFAVGGAVAGYALVTGLTLYIPILCLAMLVSSLSDIIQIGYFKLTHGKRVFRMAPLHHHFELSGMKETKIVAMYAISTIVLSLLCLCAFS